MAVAPELQGRIIQLREERGLSIRQIAQALDLHDSTVSYHLRVTATEKNGRPPAEVKATPALRKVAVRNGREVVSFTVCDDRLIRELRAAGLGCRRIARWLEPPRTAPTVRSRLSSLALRDARIAAGALILDRAS